MTIISGWIETSFREIATLIKGVSYASEDYCGPDAGAIFLTIKCVSKAGGFKPEGIKYFKGKITVSQELHLGDLLIANTDLTRAGDIVGAPIVVPLLRDQKITMSMDLSKVIENATKIDRYFLYYKLMTDPVRRFMRDHASGSTVLHLQTRAVPMLELDIPTSKLEQTKIAEIFSTVDRAIEQTEALIAKQQRTKTGLMQDLLTRGIDEHGNLRSEETHQFKDSPLGRIPVEWVVTRLSSFVARLDAGVSVNSEDKPCGVGQVGVLKTSALHKGRFLPNQNKAIIKTEEARAKVSPRAGTVLISRMNTPDLVGESCYVDRNYPHLFLPDRIWMTVFHDGKEQVGKWLSFVLISPPVRNYITLHATGTSGSMKNLPKASLLKMPLCAPREIKELAHLVQVLKMHESAMDKTDVCLAKLRRLKTALMQDLLTGRRRVTALLPKPEEASA
jgi:type I restriction enzyme S subunit